MTAEPSLRIDKWMWYARFFKSRSQATQLAAKGRIRIDGKVIRRAHYPIKVGDVLTFPQARRIRVVRILALATRRGPAPEAQALYEDLLAAESGNQSSPPMEAR